MERSIFLIEKGKTRTKTPGSCFEKYNESGGAGDHDAANNN